jgi:hypothetical protein
MRFTCAKGHITPRARIAFLSVMATRFRRERPPGNEARITPLADISQAGMSAASPYATTQEAE